MFIVYFVIAPEFVVRLEAFEEVCAGGSVTFQCQWKACPRPHVKWFKDDEEITTDHPYFTVSQLLKSQIKVHTTTETEMDR